MEWRRTKLAIMLEKRFYLWSTIISGFLVLAAFIYIQLKVIGGVQNFGVWLAVIPKVNLLLLIITSALFGLLLSLQVYVVKEKVCALREKSISASSGTIGAMIALLVPACPACLSLATLFLPAAAAISFGQFITQYNTLLLLISIALMLFGLFALSGFKIEKK